MNDTHDGFHSLATNNVSELLLTSLVSCAGWPSGRPAPTLAVLGMRKEDRVGNPRMQALARMVGSVGARLALPALRLNLRLPG